MTSPRKLVPMISGELHEVRRDFGIRAFATHHGGASLGFVLISIREKLKVLPESDPLIKKLRQKLFEQENQLEEYEAKIKDLSLKADKQRKEFETYLAGLTIEK